MPFDETSPLPVQPMPPISGSLALDPSFSDTAGAAFRQENLIGSIASSERMRAQMDGTFHDIDKAYNVFDDLKGYEDHIDRFESVFNAKAAKAVKADIDRETRDRKILAASGWTGFGLTAAAAILDPTFLIPGGALVKTGRAAPTVSRTALSVGAAAGVATAVQEAGLQATQELRTAGETALNIGGSVILGGLLGAGAGSIMSAMEARRAAAVLKDAERPDFDAATDVLHKELTEMAGTPQSAGAAAAPRDTLDDLSIAGKAASAVAKATAQLNPMLRTLQSPSATVRGIASQMIETPVYLRKNLRGEGDTAAETAMHEYTRGAVVQALEAQSSAYTNARKAGVTLTRKEFREEVGRAMRRGDKSDIPGVAEAAKAWRSSVIEPLKQRAISAGLLPADVSVSTAESYLTRMWNRPAIEGNEQEFRTVVRDWLSGSLDDAIKADTARVDRRVINLQRERDEIDIGILRREGSQTPEDAISEVMRRINAGETVQAPQSLSGWLRGLGQDGIFDEAGELASVFPDARQIPGLLRKSRRGTANPSGGMDLNEVVARAVRDGFLGDAGSPHPAGVADFLEALAADLRGSRVVRAADREAGRMADDFERMVQAFARAGVDTATAAVKDIGATVSRILSDMDRGRMAQLEGSIRDAQGRGRFGFLDDADRAAYLDEIVDDIFAKVTGRGLDGEMPSDLTISKRGPLKERTFNIPDRLVERYLDNDIEFVGRRYARIMSADIELAERFGSPNMKGPIEAIRNEYGALRADIEANPDLDGPVKVKELQRINARENADIRDIEAVRDMLRGNYRPEIQHTGWAKTLAAANTFNYMVALGGVVVSSLTDAVRPAMVHGLKSYMRDGLAPLIRNMQAVKMSRQEAALAGAISEKWLASRLATLAEITDPYAMNSPFERLLQNAASGFTRMTGLLHWNDFQKGIASTMVQNRILQNAEIAATKGFAALPDAEKAYMGFLGIGQDRAETLGKLFGQHGETLEGVRVANTERWGDEAQAAFLRRAYRAAINKDVDSIIVTKSAGDTPLFANTPAGRAILQFKSFALASNQRVLIRGLQEDTTRFVGGMVGMATIGMLIYMLKQIETGREISNNPGTWIAEGLDRSGIFSVAFEVNNALEKIGAPGLYTGAAAMFPDASQKQPASRFAVRSQVGTFLGPSFGSATDVAGVVSLGLKNLERAWGGDGARATEGDVASARRLVPYASLPYWRWLIDGMVVPEVKKAVK